MIRFEDMRSLAPSYSLDLNTLGLDSLVVGSADGSDGAVPCLLEAPGVVSTDGTSADWIESGAD
jgi:hypothetical protein